VVTSRTESTTEFTVATDVPVSSREAFERKSPTHAYVRALVDFTNIL